MYRGLSTQFEPVYVKSPDPACRIAVTAAGFDPRRIEPLPVAPNPTKLRGIQGLGLACQDLGVRFFSRKRDARTMSVHGLVVRCPAPCMRNLLYNGQLCEED